MTPSPADLAGPRPLRAAVIIDYQNIHLTAHNLFSPDSPAHEALVDPMLFSRALIEKRNSDQSAGHPRATLGSVTACRGLPSSDHDWEQNRRCRDQASNWRTAGATVELRPLKYDYQRGADGRPIMTADGKKIPVGSPREKGVDVLVAVKALSAALNPGIDLVIIASHDTDMIPILDELYDMNGQGLTDGARVETASWFNRELFKENRFGGRQIRPSTKPDGKPRGIWNTRLERSQFEASLDRRDYR
ncbi:hypothetical protein ACT3S7_15140 [Corynebacterium sp. AOP34-AQ2-28]|uniref:hypothetical protein n=1 Tax=Corynebacterium sp. AOP34-AQ2-28 TaxID=3457689 RepID=UPI0040339E53